MVASCSFAPAVEWSTDKNSTRPCLAACRIADTAASRTKTRPGAQFHRLVRRFGGHRSPRAKKKAAVAVAHTLLLITYCILDRHLPYDELGEDFYTRREDPERYKDKLIARLARLGYTVTVQPAHAA
jgi:hypothetical protein